MDNLEEEEVQMTLATSDGKDSDKKIKKVMQKLNEHVENAIDRSIN